jgi:hypothetical protein
VNGFAAGSVQAISPSALVRTSGATAATRYTNGVSQPAAQAVSPGAAVQTSASSATTRYSNGVPTSSVATLVPKYTPPFGDVDCSNTVNSIDSLKILRKNAALDVIQSEPCTDITSMLPLGKLQGDVDCGGAVNAIDALKVLRFSAGLSVAQAAGCPLIGQ